MTTEYRAPDMSFKTAKNIVWHWDNNTKESERIPVGAIIKARNLVASVNARVFASQKLFFVAVGLLFLASRVN